MGRPSGPLVGGPVGPRAAGNGPAGVGPGFSRGILARRRKKKRKKRENPLMLKMKIRWFLDCSLILEEFLLFSLLPLDRFCCCGENLERENKILENLERE